MKHALTQMQCRFAVIHETPSIYHMVLVAVGVGIAGTLIQGSFVNMCVVNVYHRGASLLTWKMPKKTYMGWGMLVWLKLTKYWCLMYMVRALSLAALKK